MSLENPTTFERITAWPHFKLVALIAGLIAVIGFGLFVVDRCDSYSAKRTTDKKRANVNTAIDQLKQANANVAAAQKELANATANVAVAADDYLEATNVTDGTREAVNAAIERQKQAANVNRNVNAQDVEEAMRGL